jgi:hypothetical protein
MKRQSNLIHGYLGEGKESLNDVDITWSSQRVLWLWV